LIGSNIPFTKILGLLHPEAVNQFNLAASSAIGNEQKEYNPLKRILHTVVAVLVTLCGCTTQAAPPIPRRPNIVIVTLDTTRADRMGFLGSKLGLTPNLDVFAQRSVIFSRAYAVEPITTASHATILTGTYPELNGVTDFGKPLPSAVPYLPAILRENGYHTAAFVGSLVLDPIGGTAPGFDRGFELYDSGFRTRRPGEDRFHTLERRGGEVVEHAVKWLAKRPNGPFFLWVHLYDAHDPYDPPAPYSTRFVGSLYNGEIAYADACVGTLIKALREMGLYDETLIAVMSDHGEALGQHGEETHGIFLYDETIHVPLLFKLPSSSSSIRVETRASLVDITPTLLDLADIPIPGAMQGQSLKTVMLRPPTTSARFNTAAAGNIADRPAYSETDYPHRAFGWSALRSVRVGKYLFVRAPAEELYDQALDPQALNNLALKSPAVSSTLSAQVEDFRRKLGVASNPTAGSAASDAQQGEQLGALGYVSAGPAASTESKQQGADPKDRIEIANLMHNALLEVEDGRYEEAVPHLKTVLATEPQMTVAQMQLGVALARLKRPAEALPLLRSAVSKQPDSGMAHYELGLALFDSGNLNSAAPEFAFAVEHAPRWADAHFSVASVLARIDRVPEAMTELATALELNPEHYRANLLKGRILSLQGHAVDGLPSLEKAAQVEPRSVEAHLFLADAYEQVGQPASASREREIAEKLKSQPRP
jgi:arylsulfatase A-like enzyme/Tfp pilus assembly protein PilF